MSTRNAEFKKKYKKVKIAIHNDNIGKKIIIYICVYENMVSSS